MKYFLVTAGSGWRGWWLLINVDGSRPDFILPAGKVTQLRHSLGLVATSASASLMSQAKNNRDFVAALWNAKLAPYADGYFAPYYDGLL